MAFFNKRKGKSVETVKVEDVKVATTTIVSNYEDGSEDGPRCVKWYFLVREKDGKWYELFSNRLIEKEEDTHDDIFRILRFDTPYIEKLENLTDHLTDQTRKVIELKELFDFILIMNVDERLKASTRAKTENANKGE